MNKIIDGKMISSQLRNELKTKVTTLLKKPHLVVIQIGNNEASQVYIKAKCKACDEVGIEFTHLKFPEEINQEEVIKAINKLNNDSSVSSILVQLPLPKHLHERSILETINPLKDVDGLTSANLGKILINEDGIISCTPYGIMKLLEYSNISLEGQHVVIVGRSNLVGKPLISLCLNKNATVTVCHSKTNDLSFYTKQADILIVAVGIKHLITSEMIKDNAVIIDVGINRENGKLYGDVDFEHVKEKVRLITPVPGGVGPMTVTMLLYNVMINYEKTNN